MKAAAYYNEIDAYAASWIRNLIAAGLVSPGDVDERDIRDVRPSDLHGYAQCHFFAGIGVWSYALRAAGWADDRPVWTGSCPCQPFSAAGRRGGTADERHLWPHFHHLIRECRPPVVLGEQVASKDGLGWLDLVQADLEGSGYACGAVDLCAAGVGAPHIRQRLWWVAEDALAYHHPAGRGVERGLRLQRPELHDADGRRPDGGLANSDGERCNVGRSASEREARSSAGASGCRELGRLADAHGRDARAEGLQRGGQHGLVASDGGAGRLADAAQLRPSTGSRVAGFGHQQVQPERSRGASGPGPTNGFWRDPDWLFCRDDKWRPVEPGTFPLAHGAPARGGRLRAYGNAINKEAAQAFIKAYLDLRTIDLSAVEC